MPRAGPDGQPRRWKSANLAAVEKTSPLDKKLTACRLDAGHWHAAAGVYHHGKAWGRPTDSGWVWLNQIGERWWAWTSPVRPTWLWNGGRWWWHSKDLWFMLHEGEVWGYRMFQEYRKEGLIHPDSGSQMIYSNDGLRAALITPGDGAWLFDARTGETLQRWTEEQLPAQPRPHAPGSVALPR
jgi:hypothetical protein